MYTGQLRIETEHTVEKTCIIATLYTNNNIQLENVHNVDIHTCKQYTHIVHKIVTDIIIVDPNI